MSTFFCRHTTLATRSLMRVFMVGHNEAKGIYFVCLFIFSTSAAAVAFLANTFSCIYYFDFSMFQWDRRMIYYLF